MVVSLFIRRDVTRRNIVFYSINQLGIPYFTTSLLSTKSFRCSKTSQQSNEQSFTVSYLINSCGLSLELANSASKKVNLETPDKPDSVLSFFRDHGFTDAHISKIIRKRPSVLLANVEKSFLPKFDFFRSVGASSYDIVELFSCSGCLFYSSLEKSIIPCYDVLKSLLIYDYKVIRTLKRASHFVTPNYLTPNLEFLRNLEVPQSSISILISCFPAVVFFKPSKFQDVAKKIIKMGINPSTSNFVYAIYVRTCLRRSNWESKFEVYGRWGWSKDDTLLAFKSYPQCMGYSEKKITQVMEFLVMKMGWPSEAVLKFPRAFSYNLQKRIIPRCSVFQALKKNGLIKRDVSLSALLSHAEQHFLKNFVTKFEDRLPQLLDVYRGKIYPYDLRTKPADGEK